MFYYLHNKTQLDTNMDTRVKTALQAMQQVSQHFGLIPYSLKMSYFLTRIKCFPKAITSKLEIFQSLL